MLFVKLQVEQVVPLQFAFTCVRHHHIRLRAGKVSAYACVALTGQPALFRWGACSFSPLSGIRRGRRSWLYMSVGEAGAWGGGGYTASAPCLAIMVSPMFLRSFQRRQCALLY